MTTSYILQANAIAYKLTIIDPLLLKNTTLLRKQCDDIWKEQKNIANNEKLIEDFIKSCYAVAANTKSVGKNLLLRQKTPSDENFTAQPNSEQTTKKILHKTLKRKRNAQEPLESEIHEIELRLESLKPRLQSLEAVAISDDQDSMDLVRKKRLEIAKLEDSLQNKQEVLNKKKKNVEYQSRYRQKIKDGVVSVIPNSRGRKRVITGSMNQFNQRLEGREETISQDM